MSDKVTRLVPPFCVQALQSNGIVIPPPKLPNIKTKKTYKFHKYYKRGDIPVGIKFNTDNQNKLILMWNILPDKLDYSFYLPLFFSGLTESKFPVSYLVQNGIHDMLNFGKDKVLPVLPQLVLPIKRALETENPAIVPATLLIIRHLLKTEKRIGIALVQYYYVLLPILHFLLSRSRINIQRDIERTLELLEKCGTLDAYINIKYFVPTYESCIFN